MIERGKIKIENCPFCGSNRVVISSFKTEAEANVFTARCNNCGCSIQRLSYNEVILAWNNRRHGK